MVYDLYRAWSLGIWDLGLMFRWLLASEPPKVDFPNILYWFLTPHYLGPWTLRVRGEYIPQAQPEGCLNIPKNWKAEASRVCSLQTLDPNTGSVFVRGNSVYCQPNCRI